MERKALQRLETLQQLNSDREWRNRDLYRLMYREDLYIVAYERIKSKPGNMTPGTDGETIDGFSLTTIQKIVSEMKTESYQFKPVRQKGIPKANGKIRYLGIPSTRDKVVQEVMRMILEAIYDSPKGPYFLDCSHGFRPRRGTHTALRDFRRDWSGTNWIIEGDIKAFFDEIDHQALIDILRKKIDDERFLNLVRKLLKAGYLEEMTRRKRDSLAGTPQGGIVSPILANVFLHEFDEKVMEIKKRLDKGEQKRDNPAYQELYNQRRRLFRQAGGKLTGEVKAVIKLMRETPAVDPNDPDFIRVKYLRYADDWIVGVSGPRSIAEEIKQEAGAFLKDRLKLKLSEEKTKITHTRKEWAKFLGTLLRIGRGDGHTGITTHTYADGRKVKKRSVGWQPVMYAPIPELVKKLHKDGFCDHEGQPKEKTVWIPLDPDQIVNLFSAINRGILNYYRFTDNFSGLQRIQYILQYSCAKTLAAKYKTSVRKVFRKYGRNLTITVQGKGKEYKVPLYLNTDWNRKPTNFRLNDTDVDLVRTWVSLRTKSKLGWPCVVCGSVEDVEMHHVRHLRKMGEKPPTGFTEIMVKLNRKQLPVCRECHDDIHAGKYDGKKLSELLYDPRVGPHKSL